MREPPSRLRAPAPPADPAPGPRPPPTSDARCGSSRPNAEPLASSRPAAESLSSSRPPAESLDLVVSRPERIDRLLARDLPLSRTRVRQLLDAGAVTLEGRPVTRPSVVPAEGSRVRVRVPEQEPRELLPDALPLAVLHEDEAILVLDKPAGLVVHPAPGHARGTLVNALIARGTFAAPEGERPGIVHRLDRDTSGVMVVARDLGAHAALAAQFKERQVVKLYDTVVWGHMPGDAGAVERPIARSRADRQKMAVDAVRGRPAVTRWRRLARFPVADRLEVDLASGRTHQIRVHMASLGHPVLGDTRYGGGAGVEAGFEARQRAVARGALAVMGRFALHARRLEFKHPRTGERVAFEAPLPADFLRLLEFLA